MFIFDSVDLSKKFPKNSKAISKKKLTTIEKENSSHHYSVPAINFNRILPRIKSRFFLCLYILLFVSICLLFWSSSFIWKMISLTWLPSISHNSESYTFYTLLRMHAWWIRELVSETIIIVRLRRVTKVRFFFGNSKFFSFPRGCMSARPYIYIVHLLDSYIEYALYMRLQEKFVL